MQDAGMRGRGLCPELRALRHLASRTEVRITERGDGSFKYSGTPRSLSIARWFRCARVFSPSLEYICFFVTLCRRREI